MPRCGFFYDGFHCFLASCLVLLSLSRSVRCFAVGSNNGGYQHPLSSSSSSICNRIDGVASHRHPALDLVLLNKPQPTSPTAHFAVRNDGKHQEDAPIASNDNESVDNISIDKVDDASVSSSSAMRGGAGDSNAASITSPAIWPRLDSLDRRLIAIALPVIANFAINPLIGAVDLFWVSRMGNALAVAGMAAANQVFNSVFWITSFLPSITATLIAKEKKSGNKEGVQDAVCQALFVGIIMAAMSSALLFFQPNRVLSSVLADGAPALQYARSYLLIRSLAFIPSLISLVGFSAFRGVLDTITPVKISAFANIFNVVLDPILIFTCAMGVPGAAWATLGAEIISAVIYLVLLRRRDMIRFSKLIRVPAWRAVEPLLRGGLALQLRNVSLNITFLAVARVTQSIDQTGVAAAAHALSIQTFQLGGIVLLALSTVAQTVVPNDMVHGYDEKLQQRVGGKRFAKATVNRLMSWGFLLGALLGALQIVLLPLITKSTPLVEVRQAAIAPARLGSVLQIINGLVFIGEGVMVGTGSFFQLSLSTVVATVGCLWALQTFPSRYGLTGVWMGFAVFNVLRLVGVTIHQFVTGPLAPRNISSEKAIP